MHNTLKNFPLTLIYQVAEKLLKNKDLECYKWDGELKQILQNLRDKINKITLVHLLPLLFDCFFYFIFWFSSCFTSCSD